MNMNTQPNLAMKIVLAELYEQRGLTVSLAAIKASAQAATTELVRQKVTTQALQELKAKVRMAAVNEIQGVFLREGHEGRWNVNL
jgi:hypothetical protein